MLDTLVLRTTTPVDLPCVPDNTPDGAFEFHGMAAEFLTSGMETHFRTSGHRWMVEMQNHDRSIWIKGPVTFGAGCATFVPQWLRINIPVLAGLRDGCLPNNDVLLRQALDNVESALPWMPPAWQQQATIREMHLTMNFKLDPDEMLAIHKSMRHRSVHADPRKIRDDHHTLYWEGTKLKIRLYDKALELADAMFKKSPDLHAEVMRRLGQVVRLEFCIKDQKINEVFGKVLNDASPVEPGLPPLPSQVVDEMELRYLNARVLHAMFRHLLEGFPSGTRRKIKRITIPTIIAIGIKQQWRMPDGTPLSDYYGQCAGREKLTRAKALVHKLDMGGTPFSWLEIVPADGWGTLAIPILPPVL